jgi:hypothetical protein
MPKDATKPAALKPAALRKLACSPSRSLRREIRGLDVEQVNSFFERTLPSLFEDDGSCDEKSNLLLCLARLIARPDVESLKAQLLRTWLARGDLKVLLESSEPARLKPSMILLANFAGAVPEETARALLQADPDLFFVCILLRRAATESNSRCYNMLNALWQMRKVTCLCIALQEKHVQTVLLGVLESRRSQFVGMAVQVLIASAASSRLLQRLFLAVCARIARADEKEDEKQTLQELLDALDDMLDEVVFSAEAIESLLVGLGADSLVTSRSSLHALNDCVMRFENLEGIWDLLQPFPQSSKLWAVMFADDVTEDQSIMALFVLGLLASRRDVQVAVGSCARVVELLRRPCLEPVLSEHLLFLAAELVSSHQTCRVERAHEMLAAGILEVQVPFAQHECEFMELWAELSETAPDAVAEHVLGKFGKFDNGSCVLQTLGQDSDPDHDQEQALHTLARANPRVAAWLVTNGKAHLLPRFP